MSKERESPATYSASLTSHHDNFIIILMIAKSFYKETSLYKIENGE